MTDRCQYRAPKKNRISRSEAEEESWGREPLVTKIKSQKIERQLYHPKRTACDQPENDNELVAYLEALVVIEIGLALLCGIALILVFNCWIMRQHLRAIEEQLKLTSETLQLEIHAIRDVMEEATQKRTDS